MTRLFAHWPLPVAVVLASCSKALSPHLAAAHGWNGHISKTKTVTVTTTTTKTCGTIAPVAVQPVARSMPPRPMPRHLWPRSPRIITCSSRRRRARRPDGSCSADGPSQLFLALRPCPDGRASAPAPRPDGLRSGTPANGFRSGTPTNGLRSGGLRSSGAQPVAYAPVAAQPVAPAAFVPAAYAPAPVAPVAPVAPQPVAPQAPTPQASGQRLGLQDPSSKEMVPSMAWTDAALP